MRTLLRLLRFLRPYRLTVTVTAACAAGLMACSVALPYITQRVIDDVLRHGRRDLLWPLVGAALVIGLVRAGFSVTRRWLAGSISLGVEYDLRQRMFAHIQRLSFGYFDRMPVGQLMSRATSDLQTVRFFLGYGLIFLFMHAFTLALVTTLLVTIDWQLTLAALVMGPALVAVASWSTRRTQPVLVDVQQKTADVTQAAEESIVGIRVIKAFGREAEQSERFGERTQAAFERSMEGNRLQSFYEPLMGFLPSVGLAVVLVFGGFRAIDGHLTLGEFVRFYLYLAMLVWPFRSIGMLIGNAQRAIASGVRIFEVLDTRAEVIESPAARPLPPGGGAIGFEGVTFGYDPEAPVLRDVNLHIPAGHTVAVIGRTGAGKSTLAQLVPRFYDPQEGRVTIDGVDVRDLRLEDLRRAIGVVSQEAFLFSTTVRENIAYGVPDATDDEVMDAARRAQAMGFIEALPEGLDTLVGERGYTLSGGQRQRIAIARAIITDPRILILDEATASVDASTEREIQGALRAVMQGRTTIVIAHRLSTISLATEIAVMEGGTVAARGSHDDLYETNELYRDIYDGGLARPALLAREA